MSNGLDAGRLIYEVRKRPALWDLKHVHNKSYKLIGKQWNEVSAILGVDDVDQVRRKWKNLRDAYRALVRRSEIRKERDKALGIYDPQIDYDSKWIFFKELSFIRDNKRKRRRRHEIVKDEGNNSKNDLNESELKDISEIKIEQTQVGDDETAYSGDDDDVDERYEEFETYDDLDNLDMLPEEFQSISLPEQEFKSIRPASISVIPIANEKRQTGDDSHEGTTYIPNNVPTMQPETSTHQPSNENTANCQCSSRTEKNVHFLENLEQEEHKLIKSTRDDIKRATNHTGDPDYNFLVSFLPQMKKMNDLQNLQFRARMSDLVLNIMVPTMHNTAPPPLTAAPMTSVRREYRGNSQSLNEECDDNDFSINAATSTS
ncbi:uncharacterized protein isoform X2 [Musca autumnalis]|uniref:uncharacterized protein isoform X2 n=1 Tax=Musca autumnalis TaxID=221902 RepID=UPI003CF7501E